MPRMIGIDTGGTFTDCVVLNEDGQFTFGKAPTTPSDFSIGTIDSLRVVASALNMTLEELLKDTILFSYGTTVATNAIINRSGAKTGLITTRGFEDTILIMRAIGRVAGLSEEEIMYMARTYKPDPLVPKPMIKGVRERIDYKGKIVTPLNINEVERVVDELIQGGVETIAVALLWSQANPIHEREIGEMISHWYPEIYLSLSSDLVPLIGEYERTATTVISAYLGPVIHQYLSSLGKKLKSYGLRVPPLVMQSYGGSLPAEGAIKRPVGILSSGPVAGVIGSRYLAELLGYQNIITTDVGGTSFDVGLIYDGVIEMDKRPTISQYSLLIPMVDVKSIGAAGGSIARVEPATGLLKVGPKSAGADPGPVCYDKGGTEPTTTDANLILGYLNPDYFLGGRIPLKKEKAYEATKTKIADPLGMDVIDAAAGIYAITNSQMSDLTRSITVGRGYDPRTCVLFSYGGAGPVHAGIFARELGIKEILVPITASVHSAMGVLAADIMHTYDLSYHMSIPADPKKLSENFEQLEQKAKEDMEKEGFKEENIIINRYVEMRYRRQIHEISVPVPDGKIDYTQLEHLIEDFEAIYERLYGKGSGYREAGIEIQAFRVEAMGKIKKPVLTKYQMKSEDSSGAIKAEREAYFEKSQGMYTTPIYDFERLHPGNIIAGPGIIETPITTIVIHPETRAKMDEYRNVVIQL